jgi:hypothetical protein
VPWWAEVDVRIDGWDIHGRWFGVIVGTTPRLGQLRRGETIPWRVIADQFAPREHRGSRWQMEPMTGAGIRPLFSDTIVSCGGSSAEPIFGGTAEIQKEILGRGLYSFVR